MKRVGNQWDRLVSFPNLLGAARKGKRSRFDVQAFEFAAERELVRLRDELQSDTHAFGRFHTFFVTEPKPQIIFPSGSPNQNSVFPLLSQAR